MDTGITSRREAIFILSRWLGTSDFPDRLLTNSPDRGFIMDLVYGTVRWKRALEWVLQQLVKQAPDGETRAALLAGTYQVLFMTDVPAYAAVHATVAAAKIASPRSAGFVNGVLRNLGRQRDTLLAGLAQQPVGIRLSHPDLLVKRWTARYGAEQTEALCHWNNTPAQTVIAMLPGMGGLPDGGTVRPSDSAPAQPSNGSTVPLSDRPTNPALTPHPAAPETCFTVPHGMRVEAVPGYHAGVFVVQDPATQAAIELLDVQPGMTVLDACAAPGGKTAQIAARMHGHGRLIAMDKHADRIALLHSTLTRTHQEWVEVVESDATVPVPEGALRFDRILLDVPCSNTGVLRRRPDARWRFAERRQQKLCALQHTLLRNLLQRLAPNGRLVYSTCSLEPEENQRQVEQALAAEPHVRLAATADRIPTRDQTDGAFAAVFVRL
ncbi:MAG: RsmB/NOP family class I SAM-dependent RNA methyltransferase [Kiritimatiellia bacterium]